jgi:hypothetical protein
MDAGSFNRYLGSERIEEVFPRLQPGHHNTQWVYIEFKELGYPMLIRITRPPNWVINGLTSDCLSGSYIVCDS